MAVSRRPSGGSSFRNRPLLIAAGALAALLVLTGAQLAMEGGPAARAEPPTEMQHGISYASWQAGQYSEPDADLALAELADTGANWIGLIVTQYQDDISSTTIYSTSATPADADLAHVITQAHGLGLKVMLKPHVDLADDPTHWRGQIGQSFTTPDWSAWFGSYGEFISHYARVAQAYGADQFWVGTELSASQGHESEWRSVIAGVRAVYSGTLTYAANHDAVDSIAWWDALDYIGVDAYFALTSKDAPTVAEIKAAWEPHVADLASLAETWSKPIIFTEIGYRSQDGTNRHPWDWQAGGTVDLQEQADCYRAALESVYDRSWFAGVFWWNWETDPYQGGPCDDGYAPHDKPAEDVLRTWYGAPPRRDGWLPQADYERTVDIYMDSLGPGWEDWSWDATVDLAASDPVFSGTQAISVTAQAWGTLSLHHVSLDSTPYHWLELYVQKSSAAQELAAFASDGDDTELRYRPLEDCRYTDGKPIKSDVWTRVRIPLEHLDAAERQLQRISIKNHSSHPSSFWVDEVRLVAAAWVVYLPVIVRDGL